MFALITFQPYFVGMAVGCWALSAKHRQLANKAAYDANIAMIFAETGETLVLPKFPLVRKKFVKIALIWLISFFLFVALFIWWDWSHG